MANLQFGDHIKLPTSTHQINGVQNVVPIRYDTINENWIICAQKNATHMLIVVDACNEIDTSKTEYIVIEIGKCKNLYLLADAIVD